ncbi:MAG: aconitate hydratase AcnA [Phycisphaerae bacterium]|nr:aconitate hydratase AcnA [Phycisphaerae bacterium]|tara:strand:+ start:6208 stop:8862 length:2655 start_codon:yes stop_codon:yes gene_type:complete
MTTELNNGCETISTPLGERKVYRLDSLGALETMPYSIRVLLESCLRNSGNGIVTQEDVQSIASYDATNVGEVEIPFSPGRVVLQDFTGVPAVVDLAAMRSAVVRMTGDEASAEKINPLVPCDLVIDHSVQVDAFNSENAITINGEKEFERNNERYEFLKWGQGSFNNFNVVPPGTGIVHQVNLEFLAKVTWDNEGTLYPDSLVGTDSHTTMINGLGVLGWGVGGIEAEAVMLGQPIYMLIPEVVGMELRGRLQEGVTATDLVLRVTEILRAHGVVGKFVEFYGAALSDMPLATRATLANMAPEYGATIGFFPVDEQTIKYMHLTGRDEKLIETVEQYCKLQGLWRDDARPIKYTSTTSLDLATVEPALSGPKRPQDRILLSAMKSKWFETRTEMFGHEEVASAETQCDGETFEMKDGNVAIAAITSCTNTSNPSVMLAAGLVAQKANALGLTRKPWVKTSLAPGSTVVTEYLKRAGVLGDLEALGFWVVGYGCTTCIGNSGPLQQPIKEAINDNDLIACSVLSGNRNFEGRIGPEIKANYLASPPLVVAYAIAGTVDIDLVTDPLGHVDGTDIFLKDIWPTNEEVQNTINSSLGRDEFVEQYADVFAGGDDWQAVQAGTGQLFAWSDESTYIHEPPFFQGMTSEVPGIHAIENARVLCKLGDSVTTDHISPAGNIGSDSPAGEFLQSRGVPVSMFNSFGSRRGNDLVMTRGTFGNVRVKNELAPGTEGGFTTDFTTGKVSSIYDASCNYKNAGTQLIVLSGKDYGMGSSRDWAAKGTMLLGVKAVIAESYERIHRSNLVGMGVLPLEYSIGQTSQSLGLDGTESFMISIDESLQPRQIVEVTAVHENGTVTSFETVCRIDTPVEVEYYRNGGILHTVLRKMATA